MPLRPSTGTIGSILVRITVVVAALSTITAAQSRPLLPTSRPPIRPPSPSRIQPTTAQPGRRVPGMVVPIRPAAHEVSTAPTTRPAISTAPTTRPAISTAPTTASAPAGGGEVERPVTTRPAGPEVASSQPGTTTTQPAAGEAAKANIIFQFDGIPVADVVRRFAQMVNKPLLGDLTSEELQKGVTFFDSEPYTYREALDTLNLILEMHNYRLMEQGRFLRLVELPEVRKLGRIMSGMAEIDKASPGEIVTVVIPLKQLNAQDASKAVVPLVSTYGSISPMVRGKGIIITDSVENIKRIRRLLSQMESEPVGDEQLRSVKLVNASAGNVAQIITRLFGGSANIRTSRTRRRPRTSRLRMPVASALPGRLIATADDRTNTVLLLGPPDKLALAEQLIEKLDAPEGKGGGEVKVFKLRNARAADIEVTLKKMFPPVRGRGATAKTLRVAADVATNRLIVSGSMENMKQAEQLILQLDQAASVDTGARVYPLKVADAASLAPIIANASSKPSLTGRGRPRPTLVVTPDSQTNSLIIVGPAADIKTAEALIKQLDRQQGQHAREVHVIRLKSGDARQIARSLMGIFASRTRGRRGMSTGQSVRVEGEATTNTLIISAPPGDWATMKGILDELQAAAAEQDTPVTRVVLLQYAKADEVASTLSRIYSRRRGNRYAAPVTIVASRAGNSVIISASGLEMAEIGQLIKSMDVPDTEPVEPVVMIRLKSADATATVAKLRAMLPRGRRDQQVFIQADQATNSVLLRGPEAQRKALEDAIAKLDQATQSQAREMVTIRLENASARALSITLSQLYRTRTSRPTGRFGLVGGPDESVVVTAGPDDRTLIVEAPRGKIKKIQALVANLDTKSGQSEVQLRTYQLERSDATRLARTLTNLMAQRRGRRNAGGTPGPRFDADAGTNQLIVAATADQFEQIEKLIKQIQGAPALASQTRTIQLKYAKADDMVTMLRSMLIGDRRRGRRLGVGEVPVQLASLSGSNSIVIQAPPEKLALAEELVRQFDTPDVSGKATILVVRLANAKADTLAKAVRSSLSGSSGRSRRGQSSGQAVTVTAEPNSNSILVRGQAGEVAKVVGMIKNLDADSTSDEVQVRVFPLKHSDAAELAKSLTGLFRDIVRQQNRSRSGSAVLFSASADERTNRLVITTTKSHFALVEELLKSLDQESDRPVNDVRYFWLTNAYATDVAARVNELFAGRPKTDRPIVEGDVFDNTLTAIAKPADMKQIEDVITKLDQQAVDTSLTIRVLPITGVKAEVMAETIRRVYGQITKSDIIITDKLPKPSATTVPASQPARPVVEDPADNSPAGLSATAPAGPAAGSVTTAAAEVLPGEKPSSETKPGTETPGQANPPAITIAVDKQSNSLIISATQKEFDNIQNIIDDLTRGMAEGEDELHVVEIAHADPTAVAQVLNDLFNPKPIPQPKPKPTGRGARRPTPVQPAQITQKVVIIPDVRTRRLIIRAKPNDFEVMKSLIDTLDQAATVTNVLRVFPLKNTDATEVAQNLREIFNLSAAPPARRTRRGRGRTPQQLRAAAVRRMIELTGPNGVTKVDTSSTVSITANTKSNSVIVAGPAESMELITKIIEELDQSAADSSVPTVSLYPVKNADVNEIVSSLQATFAASAGRSRGRARGAGATTAPVIITGDVTARLVIVSAVPEKQKLVADLLAKLDNAQAGDATTMKVYRIKYSNAQSLATAISSAMASQGRSGSRRARRGVQASASGLRIAADGPSNSIVVRARASDQQQVAKLIEQMDVPASQDRPIRSIPLTNADPTAVAKALNNIFGAGSGRASRGRGRSGQQPLATIEAVPGGGLIMVRADDETFDKIRAMAQQIDASSGVGQETRVIQLTNGDAGDVAATITDLHRQRLSAARRDKRNVEPLAVSSDMRANAIILTGSSKTIDEAVQWITEVEQMTPPVGTMRLIELKHADPQEVRKAIDELFQGGSRSSRRAGGRSGGRASGSVSNSRSGKVETSVLVKQRALLVSASDADFKAIKALAEQLDKAAEQTTQQVQVFMVEHASNAQIAKALNQMYRQAARPGVPEDKVSVTALPQTNAVVVTAVKDKIAEVGKLIVQLDNPKVSPELDFKVYPLQNVTPAKILPALRSMLSQIQKTRPDEPINVEGDERTRSIIVSARGTKVFEQVEKIIKSLDAKDLWGKQVEVLIIPLTKADAGNLAKVLNDMLRPSSKGVVTPEARALQEQIRLLKVTSTSHEDIPELDLNKPIKIQADTAQGQGSNSLIITSTPDNLKAMQAIVKIMDTVPVSEGVKVRLVHLANADAQSVGKILTEMFRQGKQLAGRAGTSVAGKAVPASITGKALVNQLNVSADVRTNTLIMSGLEESLALAELIVKDLDRQHGKLTTEVRVFQLRYASADRLSPILQSVFAEGNAVPEVEGLRTYVTRLRTVLDGKKAATTSLAKSRAALTIQADATTNMLVVAARSDVMPLIADVISTMDIPGAGSLNGVRVFPLKNADATRVQKILQDLNSGVNKNLIDDRDKPTIAVDTRTNSLIVWTSRKTFELIESLLKSIDADQSVELANVQVIPLANADAATLAATIQKMMDARVKRQAALDELSAESLRVVIVADERSNSLIVGGSRENFLFVKSLVEKLDGASQALAGQVQLFPLAKANAGNLSQTLSNLFDQRYKSARTSDVQRQKPIILPDLRTNSLMVVANTDDTKILKSLLKKLDVKLADPAVRLVVIPILHNDAGVITPMIEKLFQARLTSMTPAGQTPAPQDKVDIAFDGLSNSLVISASKENIDLVTGLLGKLDVEPPAKTGLVKMYPLQNADAQRIATMLDGLFGKGIYKPGIALAGNNQLLQAREKVSIAFDVRTNVLIISASKENFAVIDELIKTLDEADEFGVLGNVKLYQLANANAMDVGPTIQKFFDQKRSAEQATGASGRSLPVTIIPDARTNTLLVAGSKESFKAVDAMIKKLDAADLPPATAFRTFYLKHATASALQPILEKLFSQRVERGTTKNTVTVIADAQSNSLIVGAAPDDMTTAETLIAQFDVDQGNSGGAVKVFTLLKADAKQVVDAINNLYEAQGGTADAGVKLSIDERTNSVIVRGGPSDMQRIAGLIEQLDGDTNVTQIHQIKIFKLEYADATELAQVLNDTLTKKPASLTGGSENRANLLQYISDLGGKELISTALQEGVLITPEPRTNSLVVSAPVQFLPLLADLIRGLDLISPRTAEIRVFSLVNADATRMGEVLSELFKLKQADSSKSPMVKYTTASGASAVVGSNEQSALSITVDVRTNSLLVGGTKQYVSLVENIIQQLDASPAQERITKVYRLHNARAGDIETALSSFLDQEYKHLVDRLGQDGLGAAQRLLEREVSVVSVAEDGDADNANTLLISASPRYFDTVMGIIKELDQPSPQVLIQVLLVEVSIDDTTDLGMDWSFKATNGNTSIGGGTDFGIQGQIASLGGFSVAVSSGNFDFFLRALESTSRVEVLSRPQILAADNKTAQINVGERVPFITNSRVTDQGTVFNTISYENVGILLSVTPRISPDGFVKMDVKPEISSVADSTVQVAEGVNAIKLNNRSAETTVTVQDGHTIVIGGLITTGTNKIVDKVPILGDLPGLGLLFRKDKDVKTRKELLIVLTPYIMRNVAQSDQVTAAEANTLSLMQADRGGDRNHNRSTQPTLNWLRSLHRPVEQRRAQPDDSRPDATNTPRTGDGSSLATPRKSGPMSMDLLLDMRRRKQAEANIDPDSLPDK